MTEFILLIVSTTLVLAAAVPYLWFFIIRPPILHLERQIDIANETIAEYQKENEDLKKKLQSLMTMKRRPLTYQIGLRTRTLLAVLDQEKPLS